MQCDGMGAKAAGRQIDSTQVMALFPAQTCHSSRIIESDQMVGILVFN